MIQEQLPPSRKGRKAKTQSLFSRGGAETLRKPTKHLGVNPYGSVLRPSLRLSVSAGDDLDLPVYLAETDSPVVFNSCSESVTYPTCEAGARQLTSNMMYCQLLGSCA